MLFLILAMLASSVLAMVLKYLNSGSPYGVYLFNYITCALLAFAAMEEDEVARGIVETAAEELCALIRAAARHLSAPPYFTVLCGGLWKAQPLYARVKALLGADYDLRLPTLPPVCGCAAAEGQKIGLSILPKLKEAHFA